MESRLQDIQRHQEYKHDNGEISIVTVERAVIGVRRIRVANLPPEVQDTVLRDTLSKYGDVKDIKEEQWSRQYRYLVSNGIRIVELNLKTHLPSHMLIAGHRVLISYDCQLLTCYYSNEQGYQYTECPYRRSPTPSNTSIRAASWSQMVKHGTKRQQTDEGERVMTQVRDEPETEPAAKDFT
jgi:molybdenum cofactor biosynthesis enzyme MoaA